MLQHIIHVKARLFKDVPQRNEQNTVLLKESTVGYDKLNQITLFCKQQGIPDDYFEPASYLLMDYWSRFFPAFDLHEVYYEFSGAGDFALTTCFRYNSRRVKGETRDLKEKAPELLAFCLREVDSHKRERKEQELTERKARIENLETEYDLYKEFAEQDIEEKNSHLDQLQEKYQKIELEKSRLHEETSIQEVTIDQLQVELVQLQDELSTVKEQLDQRKKERQQSALVAKQKREQQRQEERRIEAFEPSSALNYKVKAKAKAERTIDPSTVLTGHTVAIEPAVPTPEAVYRENYSPELVEKKLEFQRQIKERFRQSQRPGGRDKVNISEEAYEIFTTNIDFLAFRWSQISQLQRNTEDQYFYEWCQKFIDHLPNFREDLHLKVKRTFLRQDTYATNRETLHKLQGYALLNQYLELTTTSLEVVDEPLPFIHN